jgi:DNA-binding CsgD family transcriptional regulator
MGYDTRRAFTLAGSHTNGRIGMAKPAKVLAKWAGEVTGAPWNALPPLITSILNDVREGVLLVAPKGRLMFANLAARALLDGGGPLVLSGGRVRCRNAADDRALHRAIERACAPNPPAPEGIVIHQADRIPLVVRVRCITDDSNRAHALLLATDPHPDVGDIADSLIGCFGLTRSEAEVAAAIAEGRAVSAIARKRRVSVDTIRTQLKRIAAKLGCTRQSQIAAIVNAVPPSRVSGARAAGEGERSWTRARPAD